MFAILSVIFPIFIVIALGYISVRAKLLPRDSVVAMGRFVVLFALPALIFNVLAQRAINQIIEPYFLLAYGGGSAIALVIGVAVSTAIRKTPASSNAFYGMGVSMSNSGFIGYPVVAQAFGQDAVIAIALVMLVENFLVLPTTLVLAEMHHNRGQKTVFESLARALLAVLRNPIVQGIFAGLICSILGISLPDVLGKVIDMLATAAAPVALFVIGGTLVGLRVGHVAGGAAMIAMGKLLVHPCAVLLMVWVVPAFDPTLTEVAVVLAGLPMVTIFPLLAARYGQGEVSSAAFSVTTTASFFTLSTGFWLFANG